ncbi:hypothetical protein GPJ56_009874 [Histomonas meleagridis]|uniref:uncharacterized protein n=1 Tax=Histomonas meleagridis TaxID=135588 RepID=UPI00355944CC|nr:hypothetical protein GPJ56_009874 [Histomonas meleagridis]KAH0802820.1 hypothetical protein GO595_004327 [Histomonas meleagridis]
MKEADSRTARGETYDEKAERMLRVQKRDIKTAQALKRKSVLNSDDENENENNKNKRQKFDAYPTPDGLSRPYGAFPVFQPNGPSCNLRYYKKEEERPIVL